MHEELDEFEQEIERLDEEFPESLEDLSGPPAEAVEPNRVDIDLTPEQWRQAFEKACEIEKELQEAALSKRVEELVQLDLPEESAPVTMNSQSLYEQIEQLGISDEAVDQAIKQVLEPSPAERAMQKADELLGIAANATHKDREAAKQRRDKDLSIEAHDEKVLDKIKATNPEKKIQAFLKEYEQGLTTDTAVELVRVPNH